MKVDKLIIQYIKVQSSYSKDYRYRVISIFTNHGKLSDKNLEKASLKFGFSEKFDGIKSLMFDHLDEFHRYLDVIMAEYQLRSVELLDLKKFNQSFLKSGHDITEICFQKGMVEKYSSKKSVKLFDRVFSF